MPENPDTKSESRQAAFSRKVGALEVRKLRAKRRSVQDIWFGLGMFGLIGWAVAMPTLLGVLLGVFIDKHLSGKSFLDVVIAHRRPVHRVPECVALDSQRRKSNSRG